MLLCALIVILCTFAIFKKVDKDYHSRGKLSILATVLEFLLFFIHGVTSYCFLSSDWNRIDFRNPFTAFVLIIILVGFILTLISMSSLGFKKSVGQDIKTLKIAGFYKYTRNPQLMFYGLFLVGYALLWPSYKAVIWILLYFFMVHIMVRTEERHLRKTFGQDYLAYCEKIPRFIGFSKPK